jgi:CheY-like chemotaxis protein
MPDTKASLLIVDDIPAIRTSLSYVLSEVGYSVRSAQDGFSALRELREEIPDILLSDLNMPGMCGYELLRVVHHRFPSIHVIAMSGAFSGDEVPSGVAADAFYQKGSGVDLLLRIIESLPLVERRDPLPVRVAAPVIIERNGSDALREACAMISCHECLRTFPQPLHSFDSCERTTNCIFCGSLVRYAILPSADQASLLPFQHEQSSPTAANQPMLELEQ